MAKDNGFLANLAVSDHGTPGAVFRQNGTGLRFTTSSDGGKSFKTRTISTGDEVYFDAQVALDDNGDGLAVWRRDGAIAAADLTEVADPRIPASSKSVIKQQVTLGLNVSGSCVPAGGKFHVSTGGQDRGKLTKVIYTAGSAKAVDTESKWGATLKLPAGTAPGAKVAVKAVNHVTTKKGKFTITVVVPVRACAG